MQEFGDFIYWLYKKKSQATMKRQKKMFHYIITFGRFTVQKYGSQFRSRFTYHPPVA